MGSGAQKSRAPLPVTATRRLGTLARDTGTSEGRRNADTRPDPAADASSPGDHSATTRQPVSACPHASPVAGGHATFHLTATAEAAP